MEVTRTVQDDGSVNVSRFGGMFVNVYVEGSGKVRDGYRVRDSGHIGVGKKFAGEEARIEVVD